MLKKTITYEDFNGEEVTEDFYFNLSKAEIVELELSEADGLGEVLQRIIKEEDKRAIVEHFKAIILASYGVRSDDGRRFIKSQEILDEFTQTNAYSDLFVELATDEQKAAEFINGIIPSGLEAQLQEVVAKAKDEKPVEDVQLPEKKFNDFTHAQLVAMPQDEFQTLIPSNPKDMTREQLQIAFERKNKQ